MDCFALRIEPGCDLRCVLENESQKRELAAGFVVGAVGSLAVARLRFGGRRDMTGFRGDLEIIHLSGTLSPDGAHLHMAVADDKGRVMGGHVGEGCLVRTTAEVVVGTLHGVAFARRFDARTGFRELVVTPRPDA